MKKVAISIMVIEIIAALAAVIYVRANPRWHIEPNEVEVTNPPLFEKAPEKDPEQYKTRETHFRFDENGLTWAA